MEISIPGPIVIVKGLYQCGIPMPTFFDDPALRRIINIDNTKTFGVAFGPFKVVHQGPSEVTTQRCPSLKGFGTSCNIGAQVGNAPWIADSFTAVPAIGKSRT